MLSISFPAARRACGGILMIFLVSMASTLIGQEPAQPAQPAAAPPAETPAPAAEAPQPPAETPPAQPPAAAAAPAAEAAQPPAAAPAEPAPTQPSPSDTPPPAQPAPQEAAPAAVAPPVYDYARLGHPSVADQLELNDQQRAQVAQLLTERATQLAAAPSDQRKAIVESFDQRLAAVLTDAQRSELTTMVAEFPLRFNFREQPWTDVLNWFARQAGLALVMDKTPPGAFTYTSNRDYTPSEAIDLLNMVLLTKGFSLIQRNRMLILVSLSDNLPSDLIPRVEAEKINEYRDFEIIRVVFRLEGRPMETVLKEVEPLVGPYGSSVALPSTGQLLITETAGKLRAISILIASIPKPQPPPKPEPKPEPPAPVLEVYPVANVKPAAAVETLTILFSNAKFTVDDKGEQVMAYARPKEQEGIKKAIEQMEANHAPDKRPRLEVYMLDPSDTAQASELVEQLTTAVPEVQATVDATSGRLLVFASPEHQEAVREMVQKLGAAVDAGSRQVVVYAPKHYNPTALSTLITQLAPRAEVSADAQLRRVVVSATPAEQTMIQSLVEQLDKEATLEDKPLLQVYPLEKRLDPTVVTTLQAVVPEATITLSADGRQLSVVARVVDQTVVKKMVEQWQEVATAQEEPELKIYPLEETLTASDVSTITSLVPGAQVTLSTDGRQLNVVARAQDQTAVETLIQRLTTAATAQEEPELKLYPLEETLSATDVSTITSMVPGAQVTLSTDGRQLRVVARAKDQAAVETLITRLTAAVAAQSKPEMKLYPLSHTLTATDVASLTALVPTAQVTLSTDGRQLRVVALAQQHEEIAKLVAEMLKAAEAEVKSELVVYPLSKPLDATVMATLQSLVPTAKLTMAANAKELVVVAEPDDQAIIKKTLDQIAVSADAVDQRELEIYQMKGLAAAELQQLLQALAVRSTITLDAAQDRLIVWGPPEEHAAFAEVVNKLQQDPLAGTKPVLQFYPLENEAQFTSVSSVLTSLVPTARLTWDAQHKRVMVTATPREQQRVAETIQEIVQQAGPIEEQQLQLYPLTATQQTRFEAVQADVLADLPGARVIKDPQTGELAVWAKPSQHQKLSEVLEQLKSSTEQTEAALLIGYTIENGSAQTVFDMLKQLFPSYKITLDDKADRILVYAPLSAQGRIKQTIAQMDVEGSPAGEEELRSYSTGTSDPTPILPMLQTLVSDMQLTADVAGRKIVAWGTVRDHEVLAKAVAQFRDGDESQRPTVKAYPLPGRSVTSLLYMRTALTQIVPNAAITIDPRGGSIVASANEEDHRKLKEAIDEIVKLDDNVAQTLEIYRLDRVTATAAIAALTPIVPEARLSQGSDARELVVWATAEDQQRVKAALDKLEQHVDGDDQRVLQMHQIDPTLATQLSTLMATTLPHVQVVAGPGTDRPLVWATPKDHQRLTELIAQMEGEMGLDKPRVMKTYELDDLVAAEAQRILAAAFGNLEYVTSPAAGQLVIRTDEATHAEVSKLLEELKQAVAKPDQMIKVHRFDPDTMDVSTLYAALSTDDTKDLTIQVNPTTNSLIVRGPADRQVALGETIAALMDQLPQAEKAESVVYRLDRADPSAASVLIRSLLPAVPMAVDVANRTIAVTATARDQAKVREVLDQLDDKGEGDLITETYVMKRAYPSTVMTAIQPIVPRAKMSADIYNKMLIVTATAEDHAVIKEIVDRVDGGADGDLITKAYPLKYANAYTISTALTQVVPTASVSPDAVNKMLIVTASESDHQRIQAVLDQADKRGGGDLVTKAYTLQLANPSTIAVALQSVVPNATVSADAVNKMLVVTATEEDHKRVQSIVDETDRRSEGEVTTEVYALKFANATSLSYSIKPIAPNATASPDPYNKTLIVTASAKDHERIKAVIDQADKRGGGDLITKAYTVKWAYPATISTALSTVVPDATISADVTNKMLIVTANKEDHDKIQEVIDQADKRGGGELVTRAYMLQTANPSAIMLALRPVVPDATVSADATTKMLIVTASEEDHTKIAAIVDEADRRADGDLITQVYTLKWANPSALYASLLPIAPQATISPDVYNKTLIITATAKDHERIKPIIEQADTRGGGELTTKTYALKWANPYTIYTALTTAVPDAKVSPDPVNKVLIVTANAEDHAKIEEVINQADMRGGGELTTRTYALKWANPYTITTALTSVVPDAKVSPDTLNKMLIVTANVEDHAKIAKIVKQADKRGGGDLITETYLLQTANPSTMTVALRPVVPDATLSPDPTNKMLVVTASAEDHARIKAIIDQADRRADGELVTQVYTLKWANPSALYASLLPIAPQATISPDVYNKTLIVTATAKDHERLKPVIEQADTRGGGELTTKSYALKWANPSTIYTALTTAVPDAKVSPDTVNKMLIVTANAEDHVKIEEVIKQADTRGGGELTTKSYALKWANPTTITTALASVVPDAKVSPDTLNKMLIVTANAEDHVKIQEVVDQADKRGGGDLTTEAYSLRTANPSTIMVALRPVVPDATISADTTNQLLIVTASKEDHLRVKTIVDAADRRSEGELVTEAYPLKWANPTTLMTSLRPIVPNATISADPTNRALMVTASAADQVLVKKVVEQADRRGEGEMTTEVYLLTRAEPLSVQRALTPLVPDATIGVDSSSKTLIVTAPQPDQEKIRQIVERADRRGTGELLTKVYPLKLASPTTAVNTLEVLIPNAQMNADTATNTLVVTGTAEDHAMVEPLVKELDVASPLSPVLKPYSVRNSNAEEVYESLSQLFRYNRDVNVGFQEETGTIMVFAPAAEQDEVGQAISEIERLTAGRPKATLEVYDLEGIDGDAAVETLTSLLKDETPKVELEMDSANNQILAIAEAEQQLRIREALAQLKPVEREVEVFTLSRVDPFSAESAITTLFMDLPFAAAPSVDTDPDSQQLIVHGTKKQLERIRDLLEKMGEANVATADMPRSSVRVVPLSGDMENTLREIERLWPQVRGNRVQIVTPPTSRQPRRQPLSPTPSTPDTRDEANTPTPPAAPPEPEPAKDSNAARHASRVPVMFASLQTQQTPVPEQAPASEPAPEPVPAPAPAQPPVPAPEAGPPATSEPAPAPAADTTRSPLPAEFGDNNVSATQPTPQLEPAATAAAQAAEDAQPEFGEPALPPILIIPGNGRITIASNDLEALDQLEELLLTMQRRSRRIEFSTGNFSMLVLRNADAKEMAETLNEVFQRESRSGSSRYGSYGRRRSTLRVVPDERMNALLVYGSAADRATVEEMVEVLDTADIPDPLTAEKPRMIPVENLPAATVLSVLTSVYRSQLQARRGLKPVTIPVGISGEMTSMLELINATANSPILTLDVDETTNSILIRAPRQLGEEIEEFIAELDQKAVDGGTKTMSLVPLKGMNSEQIEDALQMLMRGGGRYRRSWGR